jgi:hypothetical protein
MVCPEELFAVRALAHLVGKSCDMTGGNENRLLCDGRALDLIIAFADYIKIPPDILYPPFHHSAKRTVIDEAGYSPVTF